MKIIIPVPTYSCKFESASCFLRISLVDVLFHPGERFKKYLFPVVKKPALMWLEGQTGEKDAFSNFCDLVWKKPPSCEKDLQPNCG